MEAPGDETTDMAAQALAGECRRLDLAECRCGDGKRLGGVSICPAGASVRGKPRIGAITSGNRPQALCGSPRSQFLMKRSAQADVVEIAWPPPGTITRRPRGNAAATRRAIEVGVRMSRPPGEDEDRDVRQVIV